MNFIMKMIKFIVRRTEDSKLTILFLGKPKQTPKKFI